MKEKIKSKCKIGKSTFIWIEGKQRWVTVDD